LSVADGFATDLAKQIRQHKRATQRSG
jgi:hypothetical protein